MKTHEIVAKDGCKVTFKVVRDYSDTIVHIKCWALVYVLVSCFLFLVSITPTPYKERQWNENKPQEHGYVYYDSITMTGTYVPTRYLLGRVIERNRH